MATPLSPLDQRGNVLGDEVYSALGEAILSGALRPGEQLRDQDLAERLGVSRTPVREALQRLERIGLVEVSPHRYTRVSLLDEKRAADTDEFVAYLMADCLRIALRRCDDETLRVLISQMDAVIVASRSDDRVILAEATAAFFRGVTLATGNVAFMTVAAEGEIAIRRNLAQWRPFVACPIERSSGYERLRDAIAARDADLAQSMVRELHGFS
jgi:DNA-binding GntR family transcriptional regulator